MIGVTPMEDQDMGSASGNGTEKKMTGGMRR